MAVAQKKFQVDITTDPQTIIITAEPIVSNVAELIAVSSIINVYGQYYDYNTAEAATKDSFKETYPYATMTKMVLEMHDGNRQSMELQSITNQATWNLGTKAALAAAIAAIRALIP